MSNSMEQAGFDFCDFYTLFSKTGYRDILRLLRTILAKENGWCGCFSDLIPDDETFGCNVNYAHESEPNHEGPNGIYIDLDLATSEQAAKNFEEEDE